MATPAPSHFDILEDIARELSGDVNFPTCLDAAILVRNALKDPFVRTEQIVQAIRIEPLISSKLLRLANSVIYNPAGHPVSDLNTVIERLGIDIVRMTSLAVAMDQMLKSVHLSSYNAIAKSAWENSLQVAAIARMLARHNAYAAPDIAMLAGLVHNIGIFYLLFRASAYPEYRHNEAAMIDLLTGWHEGIGESLLHSLGLPETITDAVRDQSHLTMLDTPCSVSDILYFSITLAGNLPAWQNKVVAVEEAAWQEIIRSRHEQLRQAADDEIAELRAALST